MDVTGRELAKKFQELFPGDPSFKVSAQLLNETCENSIVQNFLKWFCNHVGPQNVLHKHEREMVKNLKKNKKYLIGGEIEDALINATEDCPELLELINWNRRSDDEISKAYEAEKEAYDADVNDLATLENNLRKLTELESQLDEELEREESELQKLEISENKVYGDCAGLINEFDFAHREIYEDLQHVIKVYADAAERKGPSISWTQIPLDIFIKQTENYFHCLHFHVDKKFKNPNPEPLSFTSDENQDYENGKAFELSAVQVKLVTSMLAEIDAKMELKGLKGLATTALDIYNNGENKIPQIESQMRVQTAELMSRRDVLAENIAMLEAQLQETVNHYGRLTVTKILLDDGHARLENKKIRLLNIEKLLYLSRDKGHAHADFLTILMQIELQKLNEIIEFATDARYYLDTNYTLSSKRCDILQEEQEKYESIISGSLCKQNIYNKLFSCLMLGTDGNEDSLDLAIKQYDEIINENKTIRDEILGNDLEKKINHLGQTESDVTRVYDQETEDGPTKSFKMMPYKIISMMEEVTKAVQDAQLTLSESRNKLKEMMRKTANPSWDREKVLIWQKYLSDPEKLNSRYDEAKEIVDRSHFVTCNQISSKKFQPN